MPLQTVTKIFDDVDGKELPEGTQPLRLSVDGAAFDVYLSQKNRKALNKALQPFLSNATPVGRNTSSGGTTRRRRKSSGSAGASSDARDIRWWANENGITDDEGKPISMRGRVRPDWVQRWQSAGSPRP